MDGKLSTQNYSTCNTNGQEWKCTDLDSQHTMDCGKPNDGSNILSDFSSAQGPLSHGPTHDFGVQL